MAGTVSPAIPTLGDPNSTEDADVRSALVTLRDALNAVFTSANLVDGAQIGAGTIPGTAMSSSAAIALAALANGASAQVPIAASNGVLTYRTISGDVTVSNTGVTTIGATKVTNAMLAGSIAYSKLTLTNSIVPGDETSRPACKVYKTNSQSIPDGTNPAITWQAANSTEEFDTDTMHDNSTNPTRVTFNTAGVYVLAGGVQWDASGTGRRELTLRTNATFSLALDQLNSPPAGSSAYQTVTGLYKATAGDYVELLAFQNSGGGLNVAATGSLSFLAAHYLGKGT